MIDMLVVNIDNNNQYINKILNDFRQYVVLLSKIIKYFIVIYNHTKHIDHIIMHVYLLIIIINYHYNI